MNSEKRTSPLPAISELTLQFADDGQVVKAIPGMHIAQVTGIEDRVWRENPDTLRSHADLVYQKGLESVQLDLMIGKGPLEFGLILTGDDGISRKLMLSGVNMSINGNSQIRWIIKNISKQEEQNKRYLHTIHELELMNAVNELFLKCMNQSELLQGLCSLLCDAGHYACVWIGQRHKGRFDEDQMKSIAAQSLYPGFEGITIDLLEPETAASGIVRSLNEGHPFISNAFVNATDSRPFLRRLQAFGVHATLMIPFEVHHKEQMALHIYADAQNAFDEHEVLLMQRIINHLIYALRSIDNIAALQSGKEQVHRRMARQQCTTRIKQLLAASHLHPEQLLPGILDMTIQGLTHSEGIGCKVNLPGIEAQSSLFDLSYEHHFFNLHTIRDEKGFLSVSISPLVTAEPDDDDLLMFRTVGELCVQYVDHWLVGYKLSQSQANLQSIFDNTEIGYVLEDTNHRIVAINESFNQHFIDFTKGRLQPGMILPDMIVDNKQSFFNRLYDEIDTTRRSIQFASSSQSGGVTRYQENRMFPILTEGRISGYCVSMIDVTEKHLASMESVKLTRDLTHRNKELEQFAFMLSHHLRAPVANIKGLNNLMHEVDSIDEIRQIATYIARSAKVLDDTFNDMVDILNVKREVKEPNMLINLSQLFDELHAMLCPANSGSEMELTTDFSEIGEIKSSHQLLFSIFYELLSNSLKFAQPNTIPGVHIQTYASPESVMFHYQDQGIGLDMIRFGEHLFRLYERFHLHIPGKGLGLFRVKNQLDALGGTITADSAPQQGMRFVIHLPN